MTEQNASGPLTGRVVALAENRFLDALAKMLEKEGANAMRVPLISILDAEEMEPVDAWITQASAKWFDLCVFMTGEGIRRLFNRAEKIGQKESLIEGLAHSAILTRGPKPIAALKELGLSPSLQAPTPTTDGLIAILADQHLAGKRVGVQLHGNDNPNLISAIEGRGATVQIVKPYRYAPASDGTRVIELIHDMSKGQVDLLAITSSPQVDRLFEVARENNLESELRDGLGKTLVASVGPVASETLERLGVRVDVCPDDKFVMKRLVQAISERMSRA